MLCVLGVLGVSKTLNPKPQIINSNKNLNFGLRSGPPSPNPAPRQNHCKNVVFQLTVSKNKENKSVSLLVGSQNQYKTIAFHYVG